MKKRAITIILRLMLIAGAIVGCIYLAIKDNLKYDIRNIEDGWNVTVGESDINNTNLREYSAAMLDVGDTIVATKVLEEGTRELVYPIIDIKTTNCLMDIYLDGKKIEGNFVHKNKKYIAIKRNIKVTLPNDYEGKELKIKFSLQQMSSEHLISNINIMSENDYVFHQIRSNFTNYVVSSVIIILGLILMVSVICVPNKNSRIKRLFWVGCIFFAAGLAMSVSYNIIDLYTSNSRAIENIEFVALYLCIPFVLLIAYETYEDNKVKNILSKLTIGAFAMFILLLVLSNLGMITYRDAMIVVVVIIYIVALMLLVININIFKRVSKNDKLFLLGMSILYVQVMFTILLSKLLKADVWEKVENVFVLLLIAVYFVTMVVYYAFVVKEYMNSITEQRILSALAYTDPLTGINNRTKYEEYLEEVVTDAVYENITFISFDLNNLKKVNDNKGHEAGDFYIKSFSKSLKKAFETHGFIGRIGGDEFVAISQEKGLDVEKYIDKMQAKFDEYMASSEIEIEASFSYGYATAKEIKEKDLKKVIKLADDRMYANKAEQKKGREN